MAQAARLNLRMQKELKLLITDPPPGASFPLLSDDQSSLSSIHALIEGPEGTVYANGVFQIKIQIPERYPFQPPSVTFATPIYHPNIDTGGRICLDILNLPPKGAWQPSLNISTVLTSIGLLLSEPNPDDGLMCEASKEYKYNRQTFDQKARSMTEKHGKARACDNIGCSESNLIGSRPSMMESEQLNKEARCEVTGTLRQKESLGVSKKLSLDPSRLSQEMNRDGKFSEMPSHTVNLFDCDNPMEIEGRKNDSNDKVDGYNYEKLSGTRRKLSLDCSGKFQKKSDFQENAFPNNYQSALKPETYSMEWSESSSISRFGNHKHIKPVKRSLSLGSKKICQVEQKPPSEFSNISQITDSDKQKHHALKLLARSRDVITNNNSGKLSIIGKKLSLGSKRPSQTEEHDNKENVIPMHISNSSLPHKDDSYANKNVNLDNNRSNVNHSRQKLTLQYSQEQHEKMVTAVKEQESEESPIDDDAVIVLDSEDSEEEINEAFWPKLSVGRKRLVGKWRTKV